MNQTEQELINYLRTPAAIRERCDRLFALACEDKLRYFCCDLSQIEPCADYVLNVMREDYPTLEIPFHSRWRHFEVGGVSRLAELDEKLAGFVPEEKARVKFDLAITSVLLDAGAGAAWQYREAETGQIFRRSEGLAIASFRMFCAGAFSSQRDRPLQADALGLQNLTLETLSAGFQVTPDNPLVGLEGRLELLQRLGKVITKNSNLFGSACQRPGNLVDYFTSASNRIKAADVLSAVLQGLGEIWPGREIISGVNLGDVWRHSALQGNNSGGDYVPFHKLSQWLTYSLLEPLQELGLEITVLDEMTGLAEYRNGGFCLDTGLLKAKNPAVFETSHLPSSEIIVEWRALTVSLLDRIAAAIRQKLGLNSRELPLVKVLQGGTWSAGRRIAAELRENGIPPIQIQSDGTVF